MTDITVRNDNGGQVQPSLQSRLQELFKWDPFREMEPRWGTAAIGTFAPDFEVKETKDAYLFKADVPGVKESDLEVTVTGNRLSIAGQRSEEKEEKGETYYSRERRYGSFSRGYTLPEGVDVEHLHAELKDGVLTVAVPRRPEAQPKKIAVKSSPSKV